MIEWLHLWLGLISGVVVFIVCFTAAIWALRPEMERLMLTHDYLPIQRATYLPPSTIRQIAESHLAEIHFSAQALNHITYGKSGRATVVHYQGLNSTYAGLYLNPYSGKVLHVETVLPGISRFMLFLRAGHRFLWLPPHIGSPIVGTSCILFIITLLTGLIWWYPKKWTKSTREKSFKIKWKANWKRVNLDLHNVLGFYTLLVTLILAITGIYYSFDWFRKGYHQLITGKSEIKSTYPYEIKPPTSDTSHLAGSANNMQDLVWKNVSALQGKQEIKITYPKDIADVYAVYFNPDKTKDGYYYRMYARYFDQYSGYERYPQGVTHIRYEHLATREKIYRANYEIHVGSIGGLTTRVLVSFVSLIGSSLPITGFIIWYNRKWGKTKRKKEGRKLF